MKQSEMKAKMDTQRKRDREYVRPPQSYIIIKCKNKKYDTACGGCYVCNACGRFGCDNIYWMRPNIDILKTVECDLEEG